MCMPATCPKCGKASYVGCGMHVEQILGHLPKDKRCSCNATAQPQDKQRPTR